MNGLNIEEFFMIEMMIRGKVEAPPVYPADTLVFDLSAAAASSAIIYFTRCLGEVTFDVPGSTTINVAATETAVTIPIPATARKMNIRVQVNPTGATAPRIRTHQTAVNNVRLVGVSAWSGLNPLIALVFRRCEYLVSVPDVAPPTPLLSSMFENCIRFNYDISKWNVSQVTAMNYMFNNCAAFNQDLSKLTFPSVTVANRTGYDTGTTAWQANFKPTFLQV